MPQAKPSREHASGEELGSRTSLFQKLFGGLGAAPASDGDAASVGKDTAESHNVFRQALDNVANSWRAVVSTAAQEDRPSADRQAAGAPWQRVGSPFVRIALYGEAQSGRSALARHAESRLRKVSQRAAPFIEKRVSPTERAGGTSYTYEVRLHGAHRHTYSSLVTLTDTGPSIAGTCGTSQRELQLADAIVLVYPLTGIKQRQRYPQSASAAGGKKAVVSPDTVLVSPVSDALLTRLLSAAAASRSDASVRVYVVATFLDFLSDTSIPAVRAVLLRLRARAQELFPSLVLTHLFGVSLKNGSCVSETPLQKPDEAVEISDLWLTMFRTLCVTAPHGSDMSRTPSSVQKISTDPVPLVWRPRPFSALLKRLEEEWSTVDSIASLLAEPSPLAYLHRLEEKMSVSSQRAILFVEQSQARQDVVFLSVESLWRRFFALGVTSHAQSVQLLRYLEGRGQVVVFANRTLRRGQLPSRHIIPSTATYRRDRTGGGGSNVHDDSGSSHLSDCVCMHPLLLRQAEAAVFWYHRLITTREGQLETVLYGVDCAACRAADVENEAAQGFFSPAVLRHLAEHLVLPENFSVSKRQRLQIFVSLLCFADVACVVRDHSRRRHSAHNRSQNSWNGVTDAAGRSSSAHAEANRALTELSTPAASRSTTAGVFFSTPETGGTHIVEVESLMPVITPRGPPSPSIAEVESYVTPFVRVASSAARDTHEDTASNAASEASSTHSAAVPLSFTPNGGSSPDHRRDRRWRLLVPTLLGVFPCPPHLLQTAASVATAVDCPQGPSCTAPLVRSAVFYKMSLRPPPAFFAALTARFAVWCLQPFFTDALWLRPRKATLRGATTVFHPQQDGLPQVRLLLALVPATHDSTDANGASGDECAHLELYSFADAGGELSLALAQQEAVIEVESVLQQKFPQLRFSRDDRSRLTCSTAAHREALRCTCTSDLDILFACAE